MINEFPSTEDLKELFKNQVNEPDYKTVRPVDVSELLKKMTELETKERLRFFKWHILPEVPFMEPLERDVLEGEVAKLLKTVGVKKKTIQQEIRGRIAALDNEFREGKNEGHKKKKGTVVNLSCKPGEFGMTDLGNAKRLVARHGKYLRYCYDWKKWLVWDGKRWLRDNTGKIYRLAKDTVLSIYAEVAKIPDPDEREAMITHAKRSESEARLRAMVSLAESEPGIPVIPNQLDADQWLLNCLNGTIDLRTGEFRAHRREDLITKIAPVKYDIEADCPTWLEFLQRITKNNGNLIAFLKKAVGYALTGDTREQVMFFLYGTGANGKSTFLDVVMSLLGDYAIQASTETFMMKDRSGGIPNDLARLKGARFVSATETEEGKRLSESLIKQLTGGDVITARFLHAEFFDFKPTFKIFLATNHKPIIKGTDNAIWRRIRLIPFEEKILPEEQDKLLSEKLCAELSGILNWAIAGCLGWQELGLGIPDEIKVATEGYKAEMDRFGLFIEECCIVKSFAQVSAKNLYRAYVKWCEDNGERPRSQKALGGNLKERGFENFKGTGGLIYWKGIGLLMEDGG